MQPTHENAPSIWEELSPPTEIERLRQLADRQDWGLSLVLIGWLHLVAFSLCYLMTLADYHDAPGYLAVWGGELIGVGLIFYLRGRHRGGSEPAPPLSRFVVRIWTAYFLLAFNLCSMNTLRGNDLFELFPAMASLASFGFLAMTFVVSRRFFGAVLVMFASGLLMAAFLLHAYVIFAVAWWGVLNGIGLRLWWSKTETRSAMSSGRGDRPVYGSRVGGARPGNAVEEGNRAGRG